MSILVSIVKTQIKTMWISLTLARMAIIKKRRAAHWILKCLTIPNIYDSGEQWELTLMLAECKSILCAAGQQFSGIY